jgi:Peptidase family M28
MSTVDTVAGLSGFSRRGAGTNAERRAARWLCDELEKGGRDARLEPFWCRPNWALAQLWHVALGLVGSLVSVSSPRVGGALLLVALLSVIADAVTGRSPGRLLTPERASQNVVSEAPDDERRVRLLITANYDAGRTGLAYRGAPRRTIARLSEHSGGLAPGWIAWLVIALAWLLAVAIARLGGASGAPVGVAQLPPTVALVLALALLVELGSADFGPAANDNASGAAVAIALARALDAGPPRNAAVELVLAGAGDGGSGGGGIGFRRHLRGRRRALSATNTVVIGIAASGAGRPRWWVSDGGLIPQRYFGRLRELCEQIAREEPHLGAAPHRGRGATPARAARASGLPAIAIGCLDDDSLAPRSHEARDMPAGLDPKALDATVQFGLMLVDSIDAFLGRMPPQEPGAKGRARRSFRPA